MQKERYIQWMQWLSIVLLLFLCSWLLLLLAPYGSGLLNVLRSVGIPFLLALFLAYLLHPLVEWLHHHGMPRTPAILCIYLLFFGGLAFGLYKGIPQLIVQLRELMESLPLIVHSYEDGLAFIDHHTSHFPRSIHIRIEDYIHSGEEYVQQSLLHSLTFFKRIVDYFFLIIVIPFLVFYFLKDIDVMKRAIWYVTPPAWRKEGRSLLIDIHHTLGGYIRGQLIVGGLLGIGAMIALWLVGMPYPIVLGIIIALTDIIPYFGPILGAIPVLFIAFTISTKMVLFTALIMLALQFIEGNILSPFIVGKSLHIHPALIIFALLVGGQIGGVVGLIIAVPLFSVLKVVALHMLKSRWSAKIDKEP
ncbi:putative permease [Fictibacillus macauensis ZFHKF-1]|uniref:Putative permease n=1 Tax=Fictibacillus macauensis ZFHKF-1 TaxID=1196324 RepID=I8AII3_9BACL|nr:AI-2E family transporter [Fictibacillus macauensis]EIT85289.1 putative permease [Fictibacillus macauensis ZFHKF-1]